MEILITLVVVILLIWTMVSWLTVRKIEEPKYKILSKENGYEIRIYESYIIAETTVTGNYKESLSKGFRNIADYIFGNNTVSEKINMTAPVIEKEDFSHKIAMTVPVINRGDSKERKISFVMPSKYTLQTIPKPNSDLVELKKVQERRVAALGYTWYSNEKRVENKKRELAGKLTSDKVEIIGDFYSAFYNPPLSMPLLLRNEVLVDIK